MALLSRAAIAVLERLTWEWQDTAKLDPDPFSRSITELVREGLAETDIYPPPDPDRRRYGPWGRARDDKINRIRRAKITGRGFERRKRIRAGRRSP